MGGFTKSTARKLSPFIPRPVARGGSGGSDAPPPPPPPLGQKPGKGPLLETNVLHIQLVQSLGEYLFHCIFDKRMHQSACESISIFKIFWGRAPKPPFVEVVRKNSVTQRTPAHKRSTFSNLRPPPLYKSWLRAWLSS